MADKNKTTARTTALGGVLASLAVVVMSMGTLIPVATYVCPCLCMLILHVVRKLCGTRIALAWYGAVSILSLLMAPDKEAAVVFLFLGYYPIVKPKLDRTRGKLLWKALLFNVSTLAAYGILIYVLGLDQVVREFSEMGKAMTALLLVLGNVTFFLLDRLLGMPLRRRRRS